MFLIMVGCLPVLNGGGAHFRFFGGGIAIPSFDQTHPPSPLQPINVVLFCSYLKGKALGEKLSSIKYQP